MKTITVIIEDEKTGEIIVRYVRGEKFGEMTADLTAAQKNNVKELSTKAKSKSEKPKEKP